VASWANPSPDLRERVLADDGSARHVPNATMSASPMSSRLASGVIAREGCQRGGSAAGVDRSWPITTRPLQRMCASILARRCRRGAPGCRRRTGSRSASGRCGTRCGGSRSRAKKDLRGGRAGARGGRLQPHPVGLAAPEARPTQAGVSRRNLAEDEHVAALRLGASQRARGLPRAVRALMHHDLRRRAAA